ncbi:gamma-aminobutyric acid receptor subunit beta-like [Palaemon carinicauda]|uniref:gamma-aminobutyric acid receptor subunit beta-like n=1 Tax=Palaemon carinicauda TaxID=392227 RepID=UPI0035B58E85
MTDVLWDQIPTSSALLVTEVVVVKVCALPNARSNTIYQPQSVSLVRKTFYSGSFTCNFLLFNYPFDSQTCSTLIKLDSADTSVINFSNASVEYSGFADLPKFTVENIIIDLGEAVSYAVMEVKFSLERRWSLLVLTIFLPSILLVGIGYITLFIQLSAFQERIIMTLTTLLVMYTMFEQVSNNLPATAYIKMVDMWFFFCIFLIFSLIIVHVVIEYLPVDAKSASDCKNGEALPFGVTWLNGTTIIKATRLFIYPSIFLIFNFGFWVAIANQ